MKTICCALVLAALIGTSADGLARGRGHLPGHHGRGPGHFHGYKALGRGPYYGRRVWSRGYYGHPRRSQFNLGFYFGAPYRYRYPYYGYPYFPYPYSVYTYPPAGITVPSQPPVYIEREPDRSTPENEGYWYYCADPRGYYPYIEECRSEWRPVPARPPAKR
jgi:hypothetical protein